MTKSNHIRSPSKSTPVKTLNVAVIGLSGPPSIVGSIGVGKSCLCNRFMREDADGFSRQHISNLSQQDFLSPVINRCHFLYWGSVSKRCQLVDMVLGMRVFNVIEHTEFIDDKTFSAFKSVGGLNYEKRCGVFNVESNHKLKYISKNQLGMEEEFEQIWFPEDGLHIDGFVLCIDVSHVPNRSLDSQLSVCNSLLSTLSKKRPVVVALTKMDIVNKENLELTRNLVGMKKNTVVLETSAVENVNCEEVFFALAFLVDRGKSVSQLTSKLKLSCSFQHALLQKKEQDAIIFDQFNHMLHKEVDCPGEWGGGWKQFYQQFSATPFCAQFVTRFGERSAQMTFSKHLFNLKELSKNKRVNEVNVNLPQSLSHLLLHCNQKMLQSWDAVVPFIRCHPLRSLYFSSEFGSDCSGETREAKMSIDVLNSEEARQCFNLWSQLHSLLSSSPLLCGSSSAPVQWAQQLWPVLSEVPCVQQSTQVFSTSQIQSVVDCAVEQRRLRAMDRLQQVLSDNTHLFVRECCSEEARITGREHLLELMEEKMSNGEMTGRSDDEDRVFVDRETRREMIARQIEHLLRPSRENCYFHCRHVSTEHAHPHIQSLCMSAMIRNHLQNIAPSSANNNTARDVVVRPERQQTVARVCCVCYDDRLSSELQNLIVAFSSKDHAHSSSPPSTPSLLFIPVTPKDLGRDAASLQNITKTLLSSQFVLFIYKDAQSLNFVSQIGALLDPTTNPISTKVSAPQFSALLAFAVTPTFFTSSSSTSSSSCSRLEHPEVSALANSGSTLAHSLSMCGPISSCEFMLANVSTPAAISHSAHQISVHIASKVSLPASGKSERLGIAKEQPDEDEDLFYQSTCVLNMPDSKSSSQRRAASLHVALCLLCGDHDYIQLSHILGPLLLNSYSSDVNSCSIYTKCLLDMSSQTVRFSLIPYHDLPSLQTPMDGFIFVYSPHRKASVANIRSLSQLYPFTDNVHRVLLSVDQSGQKSSSSSSLLSTRLTQFSSCLDLTSSSNSSCESSSTTRLISAGSNFVSQPAVFVPFLNDLWNSRRCVPQISHRHSSQRSKDEQLVLQSSKEAYMNVKPVSGNHPSFLISPNHSPRYITDSSSRPSPTTNPQVHFLPFVSPSSASTSSGHSVGLQPALSTFCTEGEDYLSDADSEKDALNGAKSSYRPAVSTRDDSKRCSETQFNAVVGGDVRVRRRLKAVSGSISGGSGGERGWKVGGTKQGLANAPNRPFSMLDAVDKRDVPVSPNSRHQTYVSNRASGIVETSSNGSGRTGQPFQQNEREDSDAISDNLYDSIEALHTNRHPAAKPSSNQQSFEPHANEAAAADVYSEVKRPLESEPCSPNAVQSLRPDRPMRSHGKSRSETVTMAAMIPLTIKDNSDHAFSDQSLENFTTQLHPSQNSRQWNNAHGQNENQSRLSTEDRHIYDEVTQEDSDDAQLKKSSDGNSGSGKGDNHDNSPEKATNVNNSTAGASGSNKLKKQKSFSKKWLTNRGSSHSHSASTASAVSNSSSQSAPGVAPHLDCGPASHHPASSSSNNYFGQPMDRLMKLEASCGSSSGEVPNFVIQCVQYLEQSGLESEGIYRQPGNQSEREKLLVKFEDSFCALFQHNKSRAGTQSPQQQHQSLQRHLRLVNTLDLPVDSVASALKLFFSKLPHPIIPSSQQETLMRSASVPSQYSIPHLCSLLKKSLPSHNYSTAAYLLRHLNKVASHSDVNKMTVENLATCFWPTLLRPIYTSLDAMSDSYRCRQLVEVLIRDCHALFDCDNQPDN